MDFGKILSTFVKNNAISLASTQIKKQVKTIISNRSKKTDSEIKEEVYKKVGYHTENYVLDKNQNISFKPSPLFSYEWMTSSDHVKDSILRDEEDGKIYINNKLMDNSTKIQLINKFVSDTGCKNTSTLSHFEKAFKLIDVTDFTSHSFQEKFKKVSVEKGIIDGWMSNCFGLKDTEEQPLAYVNMLFRKWIVGTAKRIIEPGSSLDGCLTLQGPTNIGKTRFFRYLMPNPFEGRTGEINCDIKSSQKFVEAIIGKSIACFDELSLLEHEDVQESFKSLLSQQFVDVRMVWDRTPRRYLLRQGFAATTNKDKFITDKTMFRRLWVISLSKENKMNFEYVYSNKEKLWAEAISLIKTEECFLKPEEQEIIEKQNLKYLT